MMDKYVCQCCGGRVNRATMTCEYCGTRYKEEHDNLIRIETFRNPVVNLAAQVTIPGEQVRCINYADPNKLINYIQELTASNMAEQIAKVAKYESDYDICRDAYTFRANCRVVIPVQQSDDPFESIRRVST